MRTSSRPTISRARTRAATSPGLPLFAYSTDIGFGGGARAYYYWNGNRDDPRFATTPYLYRMFLQAFVSTRGVQFHWLDFDAPQDRRHAVPHPQPADLRRATSTRTTSASAARAAAAAVPRLAGTFASFADYTRRQQPVDRRHDVREVRPVRSASSRS